MYYTTGLNREQLADLVSEVHGHIHKDTRKCGRPPVLGLFKSVVATLWYLRRNRAQVEIAELYNASQSTISRRIAAPDSSAGKDPERLPAYAGGPPRR